MTKPLCVELFAGLHGWGEGFVAEGFRVVGFDIVNMCKTLGDPQPTGCDLVIQDVLTLHGAQFKNAAVIVASPPCQNYSYIAMPFSKSKALGRKWEMEGPDNKLFDACFRIQREASEAAGRYIPLIVENVRGAQKWVGKAKYKSGSFYLWGDVPADLPAVKHRKQLGDPSWFYDNYENSARRFSSKSKERREWSARIAKIPLTLSQSVAQRFK
jgi:hypothetical protein